MTRKDYVALAGIIARHRNEWAYTDEHDAVKSTVDNIAEDLADYLKAENPRGFDRDTFIKNCKK